MSCVRPSKPWLVSEARQPSTAFVPDQCATVAAELARQVEKRGHAVRGLFLAAAMPPGVPSPFTKPRETEQEIVEFVAALGGTEESGNAEDWKVMVGEFQRDSQLVREHFRRIVGQPRPPLKAPLVVLMGNNDPLTEGHLAHAELGKSSQAA